MIAIHSANLGSFDTVQEPKQQTIPCEYHCFTDTDFPPITGLTPRLQYRIPKTHSWQMKPGYPYYIWLDGSVTFERDDCAKYYLDQLGDNDIAFFKHPFGRRKIRHEVAHIEEHLQQGKPYITSRYKNGLHKELLQEIQASGYKDRVLYASTTFIYRNTYDVQQFMKDWLYSSVRYFTCDQVALPWLLHYKHRLKVATMNETLFKSGYTSLVSHH